MKRNILLMIAGMLLMQFAAAQKNPGKIQGTLTDSTTGSALYDATVSLVKAADSTLVSFTLTSNSGYFEMKNLPAGAYILMISYEGFQPYRKKIEVSAEEPVVALGQVYMDRRYKEMETVVIRDESPIRIKGDTIAYNADAFKTKPNAVVEDLLKKLPGVSVDRDGNIQAQGEEVQKVYVDGKEFFGTDPKLATRNLSADMVSEVEVFDDMSEQSRFSRIDDGSRTKAINLKLKKEKKRGVFGQLSGGYGSEDRHQANGRANFFKGATQISVFANANNINRQNFTGTDLMGGGFSRGPGMAGMGGAISIPGGTPASGTTPTGLTDLFSAGINYNDTWNKYFDFSGNYNVNNTRVMNIRNSYRQSFLSDSTINRLQDQFSRNSNLVHRGNMRLVYTMNSRNSIIYSTSFTNQNLDLFRTDSSISFLEYLTNAYQLNDSRASLTSAGDALNWNNNLIWRKRFAKAGRTLSVNMNSFLSTTRFDGFNLNELSNYDQGVKVGETVLDQRNDRESDNLMYNLGFSYTEPVGRDKIWEANFTHFNSGSGSDNRVMDFNPATGYYDLLNQLLSNEFENTTGYNRVGTNFRVIKKKYNYQIGAALQRSFLENNNITKDLLLEQTFTNLITNASFNYQFMKTRNLSFTYRGRTNQPSVSQLQPVTNYSNAPYITEGNPDLSQEFINSYTLNYRFFDPLRMRNMFAFLMFSHTTNKIVNSIEQLPFGGQLTRPVNINGVYMLSGNFNFGLPIRRMKGGNLNATTRVLYNQDASLIDGRRNFIRNFMVGEDVRLSYNYKEKLDLGVVASINYTSASYTIQKGQNTSYYTHFYSLDATYFLPKGFSISSDLDYIANTGRSDGFNQDFLMLNGAVAKQVLKSKKGEIRFSAFDLLNRNTSITRNVTDNYVEDLRNNVLNRYFMLTFTYNINRMAGKNIPMSEGRSRQIMMR